jgi:trypsin-like peptidase
MTRQAGGSSRQRRARFAFSVALALVVTWLAPAAASAWAPAASATVHPGVQVFTAGAQCTSNFVFSDGTTVYLGQAAHCSGTGAATDTDGCTSASLPIGTPVEINGASKPGTMVYNSWLTMQARGEKDSDTCAYNDLALIRVDPADVGKVNPSVPGFGGPNGVGGASSTGDQVYSYGNSELRAGITLLSPKQGVVVGTQGNGWSRDVYTVTPGIPGDSGSGFLNASGQAIGVLSTVQLAPLAASNGVGDLGRELAYMHANSSFGAVNLVNGTEPFAAGLTGAILSTHTQLAGARSVTARRTTRLRRCRSSRRAARTHRRSARRRCR